MEKLIYLCENKMKLAVKSSIKNLFSGLTVGPIEKRFWLP